MTNIKFYGASWCGDCVRAKIAFDKYGIKYDYIDVDKDEKASEYVIKVNNGIRTIPTIVLPDGKILIEPDEQEIVNALGL